MDKNFSSPAGLLVYFTLCAEFDLSKCSAVFQILASDHERVVCDRMKKALVFVRSHY